ncbi:MAG: MopE-related protein [Myxococcaceae bacterium]
MTGFRHGAHLLLIACALSVASCNCGVPAITDPDAGPPNACASCKSDADCDGLPCVSVSGAKACLPRCVSGQCAVGFLCKSVPNVTGDVCVPESGDCCVDLDGDGFGRGQACAGDDCDDTDPAIHRGAPEMCNGRDDDCDGEVDDLGVNMCGVGACLVAAPVCADGGLISCVPGAPGTETCNGIDDDCNGVTDDAPPISCGLGICATTIAACKDGKDQPCVPLDAGVEACNGLDDDCDGQIDQGTVTCGRGACAVTVPTCTDGGATVCVPGTASAESCNLVDDDCNGQVDDGLGSVTCGQGVCARTVQNCVDGGPGGTCVPGTPTGAEQCNGLDDDCNGQVDDGFGTSTCGAGACQRTVQNCANGQFQTCKAGDGGTEICNGVDDDCDSVVDDGLGQTTCGRGVCLRTVQNCQAGMPQTCVPGTPMAEACNGLDDDCDGQIDNGNPGGAMSCPSGQPGVCAAGSTQCISGQIQCVPDTMATPEQCNGLDDDCDGTVDNGMASVLCVAPSHTNITACIGGACRIASCTGGFFDVNGTFGDGCECTDATINSCMSPYSLNNIGVGQQQDGPLSNVPSSSTTTAVADWYAISFPGDGTSGANRGGGTPTIEFAPGSDASYRFDVVGSACAIAGVNCGAGGTSPTAVGLRQWSFLDSDPNAPTDSQFTMNANPWPNTVYVRVYRNVSTASCATYTLRARRP